METRVVALESIDDSGIYGLGFSGRVDRYKLPASRSRSLEVWDDALTGNATIHFSWRPGKNNAVLKAFYSELINFNRTKINESTHLPSCRCRISSFTPWKEHQSSRSSCCPNSRIRDGPRIALETAVFIAFPIKRVEFFSTIRIGREGYRDLCLYKKEKKLFLNWKISSPYTFFRNQINADLPFCETFQFFLRSYLLWNHFVEYASNIYSIVQQ